MTKLIIPAICLLLAACSKTETKRASVPSYQTIHHLTLPGTFFHFNSGGKTYLACSIHQGGSAPATQLLRKGSEGSVVVGKTVHRQKDLVVLEYDQKTLSASDALPYFKNPDIRVGDRVFILNRNKKIAAQIVSKPQGAGHQYYFKTTKTFPAGGMSGSPIFSERLGTVVGVLQTANSKTAATAGGFEALLMP
ncbi:serine protease [Akkermansiaceae bacterium]|nr:serine protease [Akkermansiaceae bacterium]MDB4311624.1 serine protease [bacterium]MDA7519534.1 serine protease [Akkermansiaceae bacterium]MDA7649235.1 serine protease [Akkermansiaceae bacterium]MDA8975582.1 serine protease [Akkermansiaceae bacterium]